MRVAISAHPCAPRLEWATRFFFRVCTCVNWSISYTYCATCIRAYTIFEISSSEVTSVPIGARVNGAFPTHSAVLEQRWAASGCQAIRRRIRLKRKTCLDSRNALGLARVFFSDEPSKMTNHYYNIEEKISSTWTKSRTNSQRLVAWQKRGSEALSWQLTRCRPAAVSDQLHSCSLSASSSHSPSSAPPAR